MNKIKNFFTRTKIYNNVKIYSYTFPEGIYIGYIANLSNARIYDIIFNEFPISYLLKKYNSIEPKIIKTVNIKFKKGNYEDFYNQIYDYMRDAVYECGYKTSRLLNQNLERMGYNGVVVQNQKKNMDFYFNKPRKNPF